MNIKLLILNLFIAITIISCGNGNGAANSFNYYSASSNSYYQIVTTNSNESGVSANYALNIITNAADSINNIPLIQTNNGYTFSGTANGETISGTIVINNGQMGINFSAPDTYSDFATTNTNSNNIPNNVYTTVCDQDNLSACTITVNNNQITVLEYNINGTPTTLCTSQNLVQAANNAVNPNIYSFSCGVEGGANTGIWYVMPLTVNGVTGIMVSEYNPDTDANNNFTNEIAFPQAAFAPNGTYNYVYNGSVGQPGISTATFSSGSITNTTVGTCAGAACAIISGQYAGEVGQSGNTMLGFDYYSVNSTVNYNLVGNTAMNIYVDSYIGIYY